MQRRSCLPLPQEIYVNIFRCLSDEEKGNIRATSRLFKQLIDQPALWKKSTVVLKKITSYNADFWELLRKRRIKSVVMRKGNAKCLKKLLLELPGLTALTFDGCSKMNMLQLPCKFQSLNKLAFKNCHPSYPIQDIVSVLQITHLTLCSFVEPYPCAEQMATLVSLKNLRSLALHNYCRDPNGCLLQSALFEFHNLKELSLKEKPFSVVLHPDFFTPPSITKSDHKEKQPKYDCQLQLEKLEILGSNNVTLSEESLNQLSSVNSLTLHYDHQKNSLEKCEMVTILKNLPNLKELRVKGGWPFSKYAHSIPPSLEALHLYRVAIGNKELEYLARQRAGLKHLHLDYCSFTEEWYPDELPDHFPCLKTLSIRHCKITVDQFRDLAKLKHLEMLDIVDICLFPTNCLQKSVQEFRILTDNRVQVVQHPGSREQIPCDCSAC
ncbi:uncharacterized protein im:7136021 isoform X1 [Polypterus senegalus]|uniref:uncharacterized protein im:7136021 isoform X1 n=1 Tax=Polypterus senegalus TaxID=55291 RepID=UPI0019631EFA|nr:uncharacterized protein im:7136021 isoform X1 [Polypterus senegalus]